MASPEYLAKYGAPLEPQDLIRHQCIRQRLHARGQFYEWVFRVNDRDQQINVDGNVVYDEMRAVVSAACRGAGFAYVFRQFAAKELAEGSLREVLEAFSPAGEPFYLYYPHRTHMPTKLRVFVDFLKQRCESPRVS